MIKAFMIDTAGTVVSIVLAVGILVFLLDRFAIGPRLQREAIELGCAQHDQRTGKWEWKK